MSSAKEAATPTGTAQHKPKRPNPPADGGSFSFFCTLNALGPAERDELIQIFTEHKPRAESTGATSFSLYSSIEDNIVQIIEYFEGPDADKKFHTVHAHDGFQKGHERVKLLHNNVNGRFFRQEC